MTTPDTQTRPDTEHPDHLKWRFAVRAAAEGATHIWWEPATDWLPVGPIIAAGEPPAPKVEGRPHTPPLRIRRGDDSKSTLITVQRYCHTCGTHLGDATDAEIEAAIGGGRLPATDCPTCHPKPAEEPARG